MTYDEQEKVTYSDEDKDRSFAGWFGWISAILAIAALAIVAHIGV